MTDRRPEDYDRDFADIVSQIEAARMKEPEHGWLNLEDAIDEVEVPEPAEEEWKPAPLPPPDRPSPLAAAGWACFAYAMVIVVLAMVRVAFPPILGYLAIAAFVAALVIGFLKLPRNRDPYDGDGAVV